MHLGGDVVVPTKEVIAILDYKTKDAAATKDIRGMMI